MRTISTQLGQVQSLLQRVAQSGSASALGAEGRGFESLRPDHSSGVSSRLPSQTTIYLHAAGPCVGMTGDHPTKDPAFFIFGSNIANPSRLEI